MSPVAEPSNARNSEDTEVLASERQHLRGSVALLGGRGAALLITVVTQVVMVRGLTKEEFGGFAYAFTLAVAGRQLLSLGQGKMLSRFMAKYDEQRDYRRMFGSMAVTGITICVMSTFALALIFAFSEQLTGGGTHIDRDVLLILLLLAPLEALDQVFVSLFAVFAKARSIVFRKYLFTPLLRLAVVVAMVLLNASVLFLAVGYVVTGVLGILVYIHLLLRELKQRNLLSEARLRRDAMPAREMLSFSLPTLSTELVFLSTNTISVLILASRVGVEQVANFRAVMPAARLNQFVYITFVTFFLPVIARLHARSEHDRLRDTYWHSALVLAVFTFPVMVMTVPFAKQTTVTLFGERYADSASVMALLALGYYFNVALGFNTFTLQMYGKLRFLTLVNVPAAATCIALSYLLVPYGGATGVAAAVCFTLLGLNIANQIVLARTLGTRVIDSRLRRPYLTIVAAAIGLGVFSLVVDPPFWLALAVAALVSLLVLRLSRKQMRLADTFPELLRSGRLARLVS